MRQRWISAALLGLGLSLSATSSASIELVSRIEGTPPTSNGPNRGSNSPAISGNGQFIAYTSDATNLSPDDTNGRTTDIFVFNRVANAIELLTPGADSSSFDPSISDNGRFVVFSSRASNLATGTAIETHSDVFLYDRDTGTSQLLTTGGNGDSWGPSISADGQFVTYYSRASNLVNADNNNHFDVFVFDRASGATESLTMGGNGSSSTPTISGNGRFVAFESSANNLVAGDSNGRSDIFVYDRDTNITTNLTPGADSNSSQAVISADGRFVAFRSTANNLASGDTNLNRFDIFLHDRDTTATQLLTAGSDGSSVSPSLSADGAFVAFHSTADNLTPGDNNLLRSDIFVYSRSSDSLELVTIGATGSSAIPSLSADGSLVTFSSSAANLIADDLNQSSDVLLYDRNSSSLELIPTLDLEYEVAGANGFSRYPALSTNGQFIAFESRAFNLTDDTPNGGSDIYLFNRDSSSNIAITLGEGGGSFDPSISGDARVIAFERGAGLRFPGDRIDIFAYNQTTQETKNLSGGDTGNGGDDNSLNPAVSADGRFVAFESRASNLVSGDTNGNSDIFVYNLDTDSIELITSGGSSDSNTPSISADGRFVAFASKATNLPGTEGTVGLYDIFVYDRATAQFETLTAGNGASNEPAISADGRYVAFISQASNLVSGDSNGGIIDVFVHDRNTGTTELLTSGANFGSYKPAISADGRLITFASDATNLVSADVNQRADIFVVDRDTGVTTSLTPGADEASTEAAISGDGRAVAFTSLALNLANDGTVTLSDVFVSVANNPPTANPVSVSTNEDTPVGVTLSGNDPDGDTLSFEIVSQPTNGELTGTSPDFVYTPNTNFFGSDSFTFSANDGSGLGQSAVASISVDSVNDAPIGLGANGGLTELTTAEDTPITINLEGTDAEGDAVTYAVTSPPENGALFGTVPNLIYSPADNFNGMDSFSFTVSDGELTSAPLTLSLMVSSINDAPVALAQALSTRTDTPLAITLTGADADNQPLTFSIGGFPASGTLSGSLPNMLYTPAGDFVGVDSFTFTVTDGITTSTPASVSINVTSPDDPPPDNNPPVADAQSVSALMNTALPIAISGSDADGDSLSFDFVVLPVNGSLSGTAPDLTYTPDTNYTGPDSFTFTVSDDEDTSAPVTVLIRVIDTNVALLSAVLPASRSVEVGSTATAFATLINTGSTNAQGCGLRLPDTPSFATAGFFYQTSDSFTNQVTGQPNTAIDIPAGSAQSYVFGITPDQELSATDVALEFYCANATDAASFTGLNTLLLSASITPVADLIALVATVTNNGVMEMTNNSGFFTAATINVGSAATVTVSADTGDATLPLTLSLCQTDPATSVCINPTVPSTESVTVDIEAGASPTFAVFASATDSIPLDPANSRVFLRFSDESAAVRGATSVAVQNTP